MGSESKSDSGFRLGCGHGDRQPWNQQHKEELKGIPKGYLAVLVGHEVEVDLERFVIPVMYFNHPLFLDLLKGAEEEYGFEHKGPITIPCRVEEFINVMDSIDRELNNHHHTHHHHHHHHHFPCFGA